MCFITESWLHSGISSGLLDPAGHFTVLRYDRDQYSESRGGGVCVLVKKSLRVIPVAISTDFSDVEVVSFDLITGDTRLRFLPERDYVTFGSLLSQFRLSSVCLSVVCRL